jgi:hypothetical protein
MRTCVGGAGLVFVSTQSGPGQNEDMNCHLTHLLTSTLERCDMNIFKVQNSLFSLGNPTKFWREYPAINIHRLNHHTIKPRERKRVNMGLNYKYVV